MGASVVAWNTWTPPDMTYYMDIKRLHSFLSFSDAEHET